MQGASNFEPLFVNEEGQPYRFYIWNCAERKRVKELIEIRFGEVTEDAEGDYTIQLADPKTYTLEEVYSVYYITECCSLGKLLDLRKYRINPTSKYSAAFCPMDVLQGHITWKDADVFSLDNESSPNKSVLSSKRRKHSGATSTDEEVSVRKQIGESYDSTSRCSPSRTVRRRSPYKLKEKQAMVQYLRDHKACNAIKGTAIWKRMEEDKVCAGRTWQSMKEHFLKHILPCAESFDFSSSEVALLKKLTSSTRRKGGESNTTSQDSDDDIGSFPTKRYTPEEDEAILKFICRDRRYLRAGGVRIWQRMERRRIIPGRSWQSLKERYRKNLVHRLNTYVNQNELNRMEAWSKGSSRSAKRCTCCAESKSPASTLASADTSITSSSSEFNTSDHVHHKRKLFTQYRSPVQFTPVSESRCRQQAQRISTPVKNTASCINQLQTLSANIMNQKTTTVSPNCKGSVRKLMSREDALATKRKILPTVEKKTLCVENKGKMNLRAQNDKQQINHTSSSSASETSIVANSGTPGQKDVSSVCDTSCASEGQRYISSTSSDAGLGTSVTDVNKEGVPECGVPVPENENCSEHNDSMSSQETIVIQTGLVLSTTGHETHEPHSDESDLQLQQSADAPTQDKQSHSPHEPISKEITPDLSSCLAALEGSDTDCSPEKKEPVSPSNDILDNLQNGLGSGGLNLNLLHQLKQKPDMSMKIRNNGATEHPNAETHFHTSDEQPKKSKTQDAFCLESLSHTDTARGYSVNTTTTTTESSKQHKRKLFMHYNSPVVFTPLSGSEHKPPVPEVALLARNSQFLYEENIPQSTVTTNTGCDSSKAQKKAKSDKSEKHISSSVASKVKIVASKVNKAARKSEKCSKLKKLNVAKLDNGKEKDHPLSSEAAETSSVKNLNSSVAEKSHKNTFSCTSLESWISEYKSKYNVRSKKKGRKRISNAKTSSDQHKEIGEREALPSCSKSSDINYSTEPNQEMDTSLQEKEITPTSSQVIQSRITKNKQNNSSRDKIKPYHIDETEDREGISDDTNSGVLHMEIDIHSLTFSLRRKHSAESNQVASTSLEDKNATPSSSQNITSRKTKPNQESSFKDEKSPQINVTDDRGRAKDKSRKLHAEESLKSNKNMSSVTACNNKVQKDITILDLEEIIPKETNSESIKSTPETLSEHSETQTDPNETIHALSSEDKESNDSGSMSGKVALHVYSAFQENDNGIIFPFQALENIISPRQNGKYTDVELSLTSFKKTSVCDKDSHIVHSPVNENASEKITYKAIQVCEISNSNADMLLTQKANSSFDPKSNSSEYMRSPVKSPHHCPNAGSMPSICKNTDSLLFKEFPSEKTENLESVLCSESDNEAEHRNISQEMSQHLGTTVIETPYVSDDDTDQQSCHMPLNDQQLVSVNDISCSNQDESNLSYDLAPSCSSDMSESSWIYRTNSSYEGDDFGQEKVFEHVESVQSQASKAHSTSNEVIDEASKGADNNSNNLGESHTSNKASAKKSLSPSRIDKAYLSFVNHLSNMEVENFNIMKTVDEIVNMLNDSANSPNTLPGSKPGASVGAEETEPNKICIEGQDSLNVALNIKEEPACSSDEMETLRTDVEDDHDYCLRKNGIEMDSLNVVLNIKEEPACSSDEMETLQTYVENDHDYCLRRNGIEIDSLNVVLNIKEEPACSSDEMETLQAYVKDDHDYCIRMNGIEIKEECENSLYDKIIVEECVI